LGRVHTALKKLADATHILNYKIRGLTIVGMDNLADDLLKASDILTDAKNDINEAIGNMVASYVQESEQATVNMVNAALAMATGIKNGK
jgi:uncharacterized protein Yka (UPF0111/DUF47 family)